jgi:FixJ family two-component response regulator
LIERLHPADSSLPALVITAHSEEQTRNQALAAGAVDFFRKPCDNRQLLAAIHRAIGPKGRDVDAPS